MSEPGYLLGLYLHLAKAGERRRRPLVRDRFLVLAGMIAARLKLAPVAAYCRHLILENNPGHMIRRWESFSEALEDDEFLLLLRQIQRRYPLEKAEQLLSKLGIDMSQERQTYYSDKEYAASILGVSLKSLDELSGAGNAE